MNNANTMGSSRAACGPFYWTQGLKTYTSYAINGWTWNGKTDTNSSVDNSGNQTNWYSYYYLKTTDTRSPGVTPIFAESVWYDVWPSSGDNGTNFDLVNGSMGQQMARLGIERHRGISRGGGVSSNAAINVNMMDGSSRTINVYDLFTLKWSKKFKPHDNPFAPEAE